MTTQQKTTSKLFLLIGINLLVCSCGRTIVDPAQSAEYTYVNKLEQSVTLEIFSKAKKIPVQLAKGESLKVSVFNADVSAFPFIGSQVQGIDEIVYTDSLKIVFPDNKCVTYYSTISPGLRGGEGVFDLKSYDNYSIETISKRSYSLTYSISQKDLAKAKACK